MKIKTQRPNVLAAVKLDLLSLFPLDGVPSWYTVRSITDRGSTDVFSARLIPIDRRSFAVGTAG
jgi:hypothetical protein